MLAQDLAFQGIGSLLRTGAVIVGLCAAGWLIFTLLRYERRLVSGWVGRSLLLLRLGVLLVLLLTFMKPVWFGEQQRSVAGQIVVAVDLSESMGTSDSHASLEQKLRVARGLDMLNRSLDEEEIAELQAWQNEVDGSERDAGESRGDLEGIVQRASDFSRKEIARQLLGTSKQGLLAELDAIADVRVLAFGGASETIEAEDLSLVFGEPPESIRPETTDLFQLLRYATMSEDAAQLLGIVLLSDGRDNGMGDATSLAFQLGQMSAPVLPVAIGSPERPRDLSVASLDYPRMTFRNDQPLLRTVVNTAGFSGQDVTFRLESMGLETQVQTVRVDSHTTELTFPLDASEVGRREYLVKADPKKSETRLDNNEEAFAITVIDDRVRVLMLEGNARWEFRFIDNALMRDERIEITKVVFDQPYLGILPDTFFPRQLPLPDDVTDLRRSPFSDVDLVIVGDLPANQVPRQLWQLLESYVSESGGTVLFEAGKRDFPRSYSDPSLERLLPLINVAEFDLNDEAATGIPTNRGYSLRLSSEGQQMAMLQFDSNYAVNEQIWRDLPGHFWGLRGQSKPGATILARFVDPVSGLAIQPGQNSGAIIHQYLGFGQVIWLGIDSTWRWRHRVGDMYHHRFWGQLARWSAENRVAAGNADVRFGPTTTDVEAGTDAVFRARFDSRFLEAHPTTEFTAEIVRGEGRTSVPVASVPLRPTPGRPMILEGRSIGLGVGRYRVRLKASGNVLGSSPIEAPLYVRERPSPELNDLTANSRLLAELAARSRGQVFEVDQVDGIAPLFRERFNMVDARSELSLWDHWGTLLAFFLLMSAEWVIRKVHGLP